MKDWFTKNRILIKLKGYKRQAFLNAWRQYENCKRLEEHLSEIDKISFSEAYQGIAYELFVLDLKEEGLEIAKKIKPQVYSNLIENLDNPVALAVFTVFYSHIKDEDHFKNNYFFQVMEGRLEGMDLKYPQGEMFQFEALENAWREFFGELVITKTATVDLINPEKVNYSRKVESK